MQRSEVFNLYVIDEDDNATLLAHRISIDNIYKQQDGNLCVLWFY
jgi:hypothetical protein